MVEAEEFGQKKVNIFLLFMAGMMSAMRLEKQVGFIHSFIHSGESYDWKARRVEEEEREDEKNVGQAQKAGEYKFKYDDLHYRDAEKYSWFLY